MGCPGGAVSGDDGKAVFQNQLGVIEYDFSRRGEGGQGTLLGNAPVSIGCIVGRGVDGAVAVDHAGTGDLEMQMHAGGIAGGTHRCDLLTGCHRVAYLHQCAARLQVEVVGVEGLAVVAVLDLNVVAGTSVISHTGYFTLIEGGDPGVVAGGYIVHTYVCPFVFIILSVIRLEVGRDLTGYHGGADAGGGGCLRNGGCLETAAGPDLILIGGIVFLQTYVAGVGRAGGCEHVVGIVGRADHEAGILAVVLNDPGLGTVAGFGPDAHVGIVTCVVSIYVDGSGGCAFGDDYIVGTALHKLELLTGGSIVLIDGDVDVVGIAAAVDVEHLTAAEIFDGVIGACGDGYFVGGCRCGGGHDAEQGYKCHQDEQDRNEFFHVTFSLNFIFLGTGILYIQARFISIMGSSR